MDTFIKDGKHMAVIEKEKADFEIAVTDISSGNTVYEANMTNRLREFTSSAKFDEFIDKASKKANTATVTAIKGENNSTILNFDQVSRNTYSYNHFHDFHRWSMEMHRQAMETQEMIRRANQMIERSQGNFPSPIAYNLLAVTKSRTSFRIAFDENFQPMSAKNNQQEFDYFDASSYVEGILENKLVEGCFCGIYEAKQKDDAKK